MKILSANLQTCSSVGKTQARVDQNHQNEPSITVQSYTRKKGEGNFVKGHNHRCIEKKPEKGREAAAPSNIKEIQEIQGGQEAPLDGDAINPKDS